MVRSLVTGATGHLGANLVRALLAAGDDVVALARPGSDRRGLQGLSVRLVEGDVLDAASLARAVDGCARVFHAAAVYRNWAADPAVIYEPIVTGTRNVLEAAARAGVERLVYTSSNATIGYGREPGTPLDESSFMGPARSPYIHAKCDAEKLVLAAGLPAVVLNPVGNLGPYDYRLTPTTRAVRDVVTGGPVVLDLCLTHVADIADAHVRAATRGTPGERFIIGGDNASAARIAQVFGEILERKVKVMKPPAFLLRFLARLQERRARKSGDDAAITRDQLADVAGGHLLYDSSKARRVLGIAPRGLREVLEDTVRWLVHVQALPEKLAGSLRERLPPAAAWRV